MKAAPEKIKTRLKVKDEVIVIAGKHKKSRGEVLRIDREKKQFTPHMTIGRVKDPSIAADLQEALRSCSFEAIPVTFRAVRVMRSTLTPSGAIHQEIGRADLLSD